MKRFSALLLISLLTFGCSSGQRLSEILESVSSTPQGPSSAEIGSGLKQALEQGVSEAVRSLAAENGYLGSVYQIPLPTEAEKVAQKLRNVPGFGDFEANLIEKLNRAAEAAAAQASPIFLAAIQKMTFQDAYAILTGAQDAATRYLESSTYEALYEAFRPVIIQSLDEVNARTYWKRGADTYNKIPFIGEKVNPELDDYVTQKALIGLFALIQEKEAGIRSNPAERTTDLLQKVFRVQDN